MVIENNRGERIATLADWERLAPPAADYHWREHRSAFELARAWTEGDAPARLRALLALDPALRDVTLDRAIAERKTRFDDIPGGPRNHDVLVVARTGTGRIVIGIEAKADETFDRDLAGYCVAARRRDPRTRAPERLDRLTRAFFGTTLDEDPSLGALRYQLLSALAGTLAEARQQRAAAAVLVIHEFVTGLTEPAKQARNARDLHAFLTRLAEPARTSTPDGDWLAGPCAIPGNTHLPAAIPVYVGKLLTHTRAPGTDGVRPRRGAHGPVENGTGARRPDRAAPPAPDRGAAPANGSFPRRRMPIPIGGGVPVIKLNVHPPGCRCGCASKGERSFVLNRPGEHVSNRWSNSLDATMERMRGWALEALDAPGDAPPRHSPIEVGGGMTTITLIVHPAGTARLSARLAETGEALEEQQLDAALAQVRQWTERAVGAR